MSNKLRICVATLHRGGLSVGDANQGRLGRSRYHWAILVHPKDLKRMNDCILFDATDGIRYDPSDLSNLNSSQDWWYRVRSKVDPTTLINFLGTIQVGKVPKAVTPDHLQIMMSKVPLPQKDQTSVQNCVSWMLDAVDVLRQAGYVSENDMQKVMDAAARLSVKIIANGPPKDVKDRLLVLP